MQRTMKTISLITRILVGKAESVWVEVVLDEDVYLGPFHNFGKGVSEQGCQAYNLNNLPVDKKPQ